MKRLSSCLVLLIALLLFVPTVFAQEDLTPPPSPTPTPQIAYDMPYPGLLPDNPFYPLKTTRDQIVGFLISDPLKKASFNLLQADKRFQAGVMLIQKDAAKDDISFTTLSKGQNYYEEAIAKALEAKKQNMQIGDISGKIILSGQKQQEVLKQLAITHPTLKSQIDPLLSRLTVLQKKTNALRPQS